MTDALDIPRNIDEAACLEILSGMARHKSYSETPGERALADHLVAVMRDMGLEAELGVVEGERMNAIGRWRGSGGGKSLMFNGHIDTNPVSEGWTVDPWGGLVDEEFICGIDVSNMKSGDAASLCAVKTLIDAGIKPRGDVVLTYVVGERQGGVGTMAAIRDGVKADYFIDSEPTDLQAVTTHAEPQPTGAITPPGFYGTDAGHLYAELGMEGIVCGPGDRYNTMPDEPVDIVDYLDMVRIYLLTIADICEIDRPEQRSMTFGISVTRSAPE